MLRRKGKVQTEATESGMDRQYGLFAQVHQNKTVQLDRDR